MAPFANSETTALYLDQLALGASDADYDTPRGAAPMTIYLGQRAEASRRSKAEVLGSSTASSSGTSTPVESLPIPSFVKWPPRSPEEAKCAADGRSAVFLPPPGLALQEQPSQTQEHGKNHSFGDEMVSLGTLGHPHACAEACAYVKRKGGCRDADQCLKCHLCFWRRPARGLDKAPAQDAVAAAAPPDSAVPPPPAPVPGLALRAPPRRGASSTGAPSSGPTATAAAAQGWLAVPGPGMFGRNGYDTQDVNGPPSVGSLGHPTDCGEACKFSMKGGVCKDGRWCVRCHLCAWTRFRI